MQVRIGRAEGYLRVELAGRQGPGDMQEAISRVLRECRVAMVADTAELRASDDEAAAVRWLRGEGARRHRFSRVALAGAPDQRGVYALWKDDEVVYYGRAAGAATLRSCLLEHYRREVDATHYTWEMCRDPVAREAELLREFAAAHGRAPLLNAG